MLALASRRATGLRLRLVLRTACFVLASRPATDTHDACPFTGVRMTQVSPPVNHDLESREGPQLMPMIKARCLVLASRSATNAHDSRGRGR